jgi:hypothetical protein
MPTFQSIPIHPSVRSRLLRPHQQDDNAGGSGSSSHRQESLPQDQQQQQQQQHQRSQQQQQQQQPVRSSVSIPRSLLTRDLNDLVDMFSRGDTRNEQQRAGIFAQMETIRFQVAHRMISKTRNGKRLVVSNDHQQQNREQQQYTTSQKHKKHKKKHKALIPGGSISVLDAWRSRSQHEMLGKDQNRPQIFSTGCSDLDDLIAFPTEYFFEPNGGDRDVGTIPSNLDLVSGEAKGLTRGYVLKLSGTSGKTQLAIQLVAQAMIQSSQQSTGGNDERIRYCYSTAGHSGHSLAQRLFQHIENGIGNSEEKILEDVAKKIEFQPIATVSQLISTIAKLEEEWLQQHTASISTKVPRDREEAPHHNDDANVNARRQGTVSMLVLDALPLMIAEREDAMKIQSLERWLKRLARHYSVLIVIVTTTGGGGGASSIYDNAMSPDIHLQLSKRTPTTLSIHLMRHPAKSVTQNDCIAYTPPRFKT